MYIDDVFINQFHSNKYSRYQHRYTILRSTTNDYFEKGPDGGLTAWVYPPVTKTIPLYQNATAVANSPSSNFEIGKSNTQGWEQLRTKKQYINSTPKSTDSTVPTVQTVHLKL